MNELCVAHFVYTADNTESPAALVSGCYFEAMRLPGDCGAAIGEALP